MAEQAPVSENVTPEQFFEELLPMGFAAQAQAGATPQASFVLGYTVSGAGGGSWLVTIGDGKMTPRKGTGESNLAFSIAIDDWRDAVLGRNGAQLSLLLPQQRPGRPDNSARVLALKGTLALELGRDGDPFKVEMCFNNAAAPRTIMKMKLGDYLAMNEGTLNGQEAFMTGKLRVEGDLAFLMQIAALNA
jgi:hypothetical protein